MIDLDNKRQEDKVVYLGKVAMKLFPELTMESFENAFHHGLETALREHGYKKWSEVVREQPATRKAFFESVLRGSKTDLRKIGLDDNQVSILLKKLSKKNRRYLG